MYAQHFKIEIVGKEKPFHAEVVCRYCNRNVHNPIKEFDTFEESWKNMKYRFEKDGPATLEVHLMECEKYYEDSRNK